MSDENLFKRLASLDRIKIVGIGLLMLFVLFIVLFKEDSGIPDVKTNATKISFILIFPQLFAGFSIFRAKFIQYYTYFRLYHRVFGYLLISLFVTVSIFCMYFYIPILGRFLDPRTTSHMIFGVVGYVIFPLKLYWVISKKRSAYNINTAILGIIFASTLTAMFVTEVLLDISDLTIKLTN